MQSRNEEKFTKQYLEALLANYNAYKQELDKSDEEAAFSELNEEYEDTLDEIKRLHEIENDPRQFKSVLDNLDEPLFQDWLATHERDDSPGTPFESICFSQGIRFRNNNSIDEKNLHIDILNQLLTKCTLEQFKDGYRSTRNALYIEEHLLDEVNASIQNRLQQERINRAYNLTNACLEGEWSGKKTAGRIFKGAPEGIKEMNNHKLNHQDTNTNEEKGFLKKCQEIAEKRLGKSRIHSGTKPFYTALKALDLDNITEDQIKQLSDLKDKIASRHDFSNENSDQAPKPRGP